ncbi:unnamed protein product [Anisakis simplex]|uniref:Secreted protein n=1 Tax=Anisakis simplex TaxID=6269 RepID=A0A0M3JLF5_ANISI|nr:unnamed protein product [Anisakis simplex]
MPTNFSILFTLTVPSKYFALPWAQFILGLLIWLVDERGDRHNYIQRCIPCKGQRRICTTQGFPVLIIFIFLRT